MLPIVMLTAEFGSEKTRGLEAGADDFIAKPFDHDELFASGSGRCCESSDTRMRSPT